MHFGGIWVAGDIFSQRFRKILEFYEFIVPCIPCARSNCLIIAFTKKHVQGVLILATADDKLEFIIFT